jgi:hypothetical protein
VSAFASIFHDWQVSCINVSSPESFAFCAAVFSDHFLVHGFSKTVDRFSKQCLSLQRSTRSSGCPYNGGVLITSVGSSIEGINLRLRTMYDDAECNRIMDFYKPSLTMIPHRRGAKATTRHAKEMAQRVDAACGAVRPERKWYCVGEPSSDVAVETSSAAADASACAVEAAAAALKAATTAAALPYAAAVSIAAAAAAEAAPYAAAFEAAAALASAADGPRKRGGSTIGLAMRSYEPEVESSQPKRPKRPCKCGSTSHRTVRHRSCPLKPPCKCGSTSHQQTYHRLCPLNAGYVD